MKPDVLAMPQEVAMVLGQQPERYRLTGSGWILVGATVPPDVSQAELNDSGCEKCRYAAAHAAHTPFALASIYCAHCGQLRRAPSTRADRLAMAAEQLLAEFGVTEPGAGLDNHEMPAAALLDSLYTAWNDYMRAKHGQPEAIFEPEGASHA